MDIEQIQMEIKRISNSSNLTNEEKILRTKIFQAFIESAIQEEKYNENLSHFIQDSNELINISNGEFQLLSSSLEDNKVFLTEIMLDSDLSDLSPVMKLYEKIETIEQIEQKQVEIISRNLEDLLGKNIISKANQTEEQLQNSYQEAIDKVEELYADEKVLDILSKNAITQMLNQLFNYYKNGNKSIPDGVIKQIQNQYTYKKTL